MQRRWVILRISIIDLRPLNTILVRKCHSCRSHADHLLFIVHWCCSNVCHTQRSRWETVTHTQQITHGSSGYAYTYIYISRRGIFVVIETLHWFGELQLWTMHSADHTLIWYTRSLFVCLYLYLHVSEDVRKETLHGFGENALIRYALDSSHTVRVVGA